MENPDILVVQELTPNWDLRIKNLLGKSYKYKLTKPLKGTHGIVYLLKTQNKQPIFP